MKIKVDDTIRLEFVEETHANSLLTLVNANRDYLREWLPWVDNMQTIENFQKHINDTKNRAALKTDFGFAIFLNNDLIGRIGLFHINHPNKIAEIGYWLAYRLQGNGIITKCCTALINHAFTVLELNRIEIKCGVGNIKSRAIAEKLQFKQEGILRKAEWLNGNFIDLYLYGMLKDEWGK